MRHRHLLRFAFVLTLLLVLPGVWLPGARAQVIYEQLPDAEYGGTSAANSSVNGSGPGFRSADDFTLTSTALISTVDWWGTHAPDSSGAHDFTFTFYANAGSRPGSILHTTQGSLVVTYVNAVANAYTSNLDSPFLAQAGTKYWISVFNQAPGAMWLWQAQRDGGNFARQGPNPGPPWPTVWENLTFRFTPEPTSPIAMLAIAGIGAMRRRRRATR